MEYYIFIWDMVGSTEAMATNEQTALTYLNKIANFCLEATSELPLAQVVPIGDGQRVLFPLTLDYETIILAFAESVGRYADSLAHESTNYRIRSILTKGVLQDTPLGKNGAILWQLDASIGALRPGEFKNLVK